MVDGKIDPIEAAAGFVALAAILVIEVIFIARFSGHQDIALPLIAKLIAHLWFGQ